MQKEKHTKEHVDYIMRLVSKELEEISSRQDIKCKMSYLEGMKRGFDLKQEEENKKKYVEEILEKIEEIDQEVNQYKKKVIITFKDGSSKTYFHTREDQTNQEAAGEILNAMNRCGEKEFIIYKNIIIRPKYIKFIEVFDIESND